MKQKSGTKVTADALKLSIAGHIGATGDAKNPGYTAEDLINAINANPDATSFDVEIASNGGSYMEGLKMYHALKNTKKPVNVVVLGLAASAATLPMCAGNVSIPKDGWVMIHAPSMETEGNSAALKDDAKLLDSLTDQMAGVYAEKSGQPKQTFLDLMKKDTYLTGEEAKTLNLVNDVTAQLKLAAMAGIDVVALAKCPDALKAQVEQAKKDVTAAASADLDTTPEAAVKKHVTALGKFHADAESDWGKRSDGHKSDAAAAQKAGLAGMEACHSALQLSAEARRLGHAAKADSDAGKHGMAEAAHRIAAKALEGNTHTAALAKHHDAMASYHMVMGGSTALPKLPAGVVSAEVHAAEITKVRDQTKAEVMAEIKAKSDLEAKAKSGGDPRAELKVLVELCGAEKAIGFFDKGLSIDAAARALVPELKAEMGKLKAENTELATKLEVTLKRPVISLSTGGGESTEVKATLNAEEIADIRELCSHTPGADFEKVKASRIERKTQALARKQERETEGII